jgi:hypothetical protein
MCVIFLISRYLRNIFNSSGLDLAWVMVVDWLKIIFSRLALIAAFMVVSFIMMPSDASISFVVAPSDAQQYYPFLTNPFGYEGGTGWYGGGETAGLGVGAGIYSLGYLYGYGIGQGYVSGMANSAGGGVLPRQKPGAQV